MQRYFSVMFLLRISWADVYAHVLRDIQYTDCLPVKTELYVSKHQLCWLRPLYDACFTGGVEFAAQWKCPKLPGWMLVWQELLCFSSGCWMS